MIPTLLIAAVQASTIPAASSPAQPPILLNPQEIITIRDYPKASLRGDEYGIVSVVVHVSPKGEATSCDVTETSGHARLDRKTCSLLESRAHFDPAKGTDGSAMAGEYRMSTAWGVGNRQPSTSTKTELQVASVPGDYENPVGTMLVFNAEGAIGSCEVTATSGSPATDRAICAYLGKNLHIDSPKAASIDLEPAAVRYVTVALSAEAKTPDPPATE